MKRIFLYHLLLVAVFLLAGCIHTGKIRGSELTGIQLGMTKGDVIEKLGKPQSASANEKFEVYRYFQDLGRFRPCLSRIYFCRWQAKAVWHYGRPRLSSQVGSNYFSTLAGC